MAVQIKITQVVRNTISLCPSLSIRGCVSAKRGAVFIAHGMSKHERLAGAMANSLAFSSCAPATFGPPFQADNRIHSVIVFFGCVCSCGCMCSCVCDGCDVCDHVCTCDHVCVCVYK